ncbi:MAG: zf-HC2 domain-containing protein [Gemmatimonadaceae bacterium]
MDCRLFHDQHSAFLDDALADAQLVAMQRHLIECEACARHDCTVRRGLLIFRNLPPIQPSAHFRARLEARLREARLEARSRGAMLQGTGRARHRGPGLGAFTAAAAGVLAAGYVATVAMNAASPSPGIALAPVVASAPEVAPTPVATPAFVASLSASMPIWPAALVAEQAPVHFANTEFRLTSLQR